MFGLSGLIIMGTTLVVLISYGYITVTILRMHSGGGRHKLFSTCGSHMTAVSLFYGTVFVMYAQPGAVESMEQGKAVSVFYTLVIPMLNPLWPPSFTWLCVSGPGSTGHPSHLCFSDCRQEG